MCDSILVDLCSSAKLEREKGLQQLHKLIKKSDVNDIQEIETKLKELLMKDTPTEWETKYGGLIGGKELLDAGRTSVSFLDFFKEVTLQALDDSEYRVRIVAGEIMGLFCQKHGSSVFTCCRDKILDGISSNLERESLILGEASATDQEDTEKLLKKFPASTSPRRSSIDAAQIFHDTAGWKSLETWMKCLKSVIEGCGHHFNQYVDQKLMDLIFNALTHTNRFVRETGYYLCSSLVDCGLSKEGEEQLLDEDNAIYCHGNLFSEYLGKGLADNWSQVRLASSVATRNFLTSLGSEEMRNKFYPFLIPRMCLNRYYVAEGVRIYSQETWRQITAGEGRHLVEKYIDEVVAYYIEATTADNHAVREAACACIAELGSKVERNIVRPHIHSLLEALVVCFGDDSWPVRDAACVACGNFVLCFPDESRGTLPTLYPMFFSNLQDPIASVRQGAALALSNVVKAYGQEALQTVLAKLKEGLEGVEKQPVTAEKYSGLDKGPATYGVVKQLRDNDYELHTDKQMYSCGSLAPKMGRGGGCMDHKFRKPSEPWELADGCVYMLAELSSVSDLVPQISPFIPQLATASNFRHYTQHVTFLETLCKQLPFIAKGIGKRLFKSYLELFFDAIFYSMTCDNALTTSAASQCLNQLSSFLGPSILRGRVEQYNPKYLEQLSANQFIAPF